MRPPPPACYQNITYPAEHESWKNRDAPQISLKRLSRGDGTTFYLADTAFSRSPKPAHGGVKDAGLDFLPFFKKSGFVSKST